MNRKIFNWLCPTKLVEKVFSHTAGAWDGVKWSKATSYHPPTLPAMETKLICLHIYLLLTSPCSELSNPSICGRRGNPRILWSTQRETKILHYWFYMAFYQVRIFASQLPRNVWALRGGENNVRSTTLTAAAALVDNGDREKQRATFSSSVIICRNASVTFAWNNITYYALDTGRLRKPERHT